MKINKILLSSITILAFLLSGCGNGGGTTDNAATNPDRPVAGTPNNPEPDPNPQPDPDPDPQPDPKPPVDPYKTAGW
jgi:PBP1b-binding outer membrane lipoprotein LpoB